MIDPECDVELDDDWPESVKQAFRDDYRREQQQKRNGSGIYQGRHGLREKRPAPDLGWWRNRLAKLRPLCNEVFPPLRYAVPYLIPQGVTLLCGRPKIKKSWLLLQIACAIAKGDITLTAANGEPPPQGNVLYLGLEDNKRRLQDRVTRYYGSVEGNWPEDFQYGLDWLRLDEGGLDGIGEWCLDVPNPRLVVIDTLQRVRAPKHFGQTDYEADMQAAEGLIRLCAQHNGLSIICAHHDRKQESADVFDTVSGTLGLQGGVDTIALLKRAGGGVTLHIKGRDLKDDVEKAMNFDQDTCRWHVLGEAAEVHRSDGRRAILSVLEEAPEGGLGVKDIMMAAQLDGRNAIDQLLWRMKQDGDIISVGRGRYAVAQSYAGKTA